MKDVISDLESEGFRYIAFQEESAEELRPVLFSRIEGSQEKIIQKLNVPPYVFSTLHLLKQCKPPILFTWMNCKIYQE